MVMVEQWVEVVIVVGGGNWGYVGNDNDGDSDWR